MKLAAIGDVFQKVARDAAEQTKTFERVLKSHGTATTAPVTAKAAPAAATRGKKK